jgi:hypothetical protein
MDYIINNDVLLEIMFKEILNKCSLYSVGIDDVNMYNHCLLMILDGYLKRMLMNSRIKSSKNNRKEIQDMFQNYEKLSKFRTECRKHRA